MNYCAAFLKLCHGIILVTGAASPDEDRRRVFVKSDTGRAAPMGPHSQRMKRVTERAITAEEAEVIELALRRGALVPLPDSMLADVPLLRVIGLCACGCRSIHFAPEARKDKRLADTIGRTADGKQIDIMVWGTDGQVTALDLVDYSSTGELPTPESIGRYAE
jgi:hypothetical protein